MYVFIHIYTHTHLWTFKFLKQKACEPLNQMTSNFVGYLIYSGKMHIYKKKCEVSVGLFFFFNFIVSSFEYPLMALKRHSQTFKSQTEVSYARHTERRFTHLSMSQSVRFVAKTQLMDRPFRTIDAVQN